MFWFKLPVSFGSASYVIHLYWFLHGGNPLRNVCSENIPIGCSTLLPLILLIKTKTYCIEMHVPQQTRRRRLKLLVKVHCYFTSDICFLFIYNNEKQKKNQTTTIDFHNLVTDLWHIAHFYKIHSTGRTCVPSVLAVAKLL